MSIPQHASEPALHRLARLHGVQPVYDDQHGVPTTVADAALLRVLAALDVDVSAPAADPRRPVVDPARVEAAITAAEDALWTRRIAPTVVCVQGQQSCVQIHVAASEAAYVRAHLSLEGHSAARPLPVGAATVAAPTGSPSPADPVDRHESATTRTVDGVERVRLSVTVPDDVPSGVHTLVVRVCPPGRPEDQAHSTLLCSPPRLTTADAFLDRRGWGVAAQLYSVTSSDAHGHGSWGHGDLADAGSLAEHAAQHGADFLLVNPLHATDPGQAPGQAPVDSPYSPVSRRFLNTGYVRVRDIPEFQRLPHHEQARLHRVGADLQARLEQTGRIDRAATEPAQAAALALVWAQGRSADRETTFRRFCRDQGPDLDEFARWCAHRPGAHPDPEFHRWCQWIADEQLAAAQERARAAGMRLGLMLDLAVGADRHAADLALLGDQLVRSMSVGAPPDMYNQLGQDWSQHPWHPRVLAEHGYAGLRQMFAAVMRHCGALRIDHVLGLFRLWWVPEGSPAHEGAYVRYDHEAMLACLLIEADRAGVVVIGEDLGTFEPWVQRRLSEAGVLGTSILWFEQDEAGPRSPARYRRLCLAAVTTHDLPPTAGFLTGAHLRLRERLGLVTADAAAERRSHAQTVAAFLEAAGTSAQDGTIEQVDALHRLLCRAPSALHQVALVDAVGDIRIQNQPGTTQEQHPNWTAALADPDGQVVTLERLSGRRGGTKVADRAARLFDTVDTALRAPRVGIAVSYHTDPLDQPGRGDAGGMNTYVRHAARAAAEAGVRMLVFTRSSTGRAHVREPEQMPGVSVVALPVGPTGPADKDQLAAGAEQFARSCLDWLRASPVAGRPLGPGEVRFVHGHYWMSAPAARQIAAELSAPWWHTMHTSAAVKIAQDAQAHEPELRLSTERAIARDAARLIANSPGEAQVLVDTLGADPDRVEAIAPGVDTGTFTPDGHQHWPGTEDPTQPLRVLFAGRLQRHKGPHVLVAALGLLRRRARQRGQDDPGLVLHINGERSGPDELDIPALADAEGVADLVSTSTPVPASSLAAQFRAADVVVMPSFSETYGLVALEAQACGTAVLAHRVGGLIHAVDDGVSGRLVDENSAEAWADALEGVLADRGAWRDLSAGAIAHAAAHDWSEYIRRLLGGDTGCDRPVTAP